MWWMATQKAVFTPCQRAGRTCWGHWGSAVRCGIPNWGDSAVSLTVLPWLLPLGGLQPFFYTCLLPPLCLHLIQGCFTYVRCMFLIFLVVLILLNSKGCIPSVTSNWLWFVFIPPASAIILCLHPGGPLLHVTAASEWLLVLRWMLFLCFSKLSQVNRPLLVLEFAKVCYLMIFQGF